MTEKATVWPADKCDVCDPKVVVRYREQRNTWLHWLDEDSEHAISRQLGFMIHNDIAVRVLSKARQYAENGAPSAARNPLLWQLLYQGYVTAQTLSIRRLCDKRSDVISLHRLVKSLQDHSALLTREVYVCHAGLPYDPNNVGNYCGSPTRFCPDPALSASIASSERHKVFDRLAGTRLPTERKRSDIIHSSVFAKLVDWFGTGVVDKIIKLSHKFIAHAADENSRKSFDLNEIASEFSMHAIDAQRGIIGIFHVIDSQILHTGIARDIVPYHPLDYLHGLDNAFIPGQHVNDLERFWKTCAEERRQWKQSSADEFLP